MRLIDADEIRKKAVPHTRGDMGRYNANIRKWAVLVGDIDDAPTVDAVEVVRCKDCKFWLNSWLAPGAEHEYGYCHIEEADDVVVGRWDDDFCSYGERKDDVKP